MKSLGNIIVCHDVTVLTTDEIFCIHQILEKKWEYNETVHQLFIGFKKAYDSVRKEVLYNILIESGLSMKLVRLTKMWLNEMCSKVLVGEHPSDKLKPLLINFPSE
jgi:hypothetical protein